MNEIRNNGYWVNNCTAVVTAMTSKFVDLRKLDGKTCQRKTGELPEEQLLWDSPFSYCIANMFGPFLVTEGRKIQKQYGTMFMCLRQTI